MTNRTIVAIPREPHRLTVEQVYAEMRERGFSFNFSNEIAAKRIVEDLLRSAFDTEHALRSSEAETVSGDQNAVDRAAKPALPLFVDGPTPERFFDPSGGRPGRQ